MTVEYGLTVCFVSSRHTLFNIGVCALQHSQTPNRVEGGENRGSALPIALWLGSPGQAEQASHFAVSFTC